MAFGIGRGKTAIGGLRKGRAAMVLAVLAFLAGCALYDRFADLR
jgi:hypothetical protein